MKKFYITIASLLVTIASIHTSYGQQDTVKPLKIAIFAPLFLNDAFEGTSYTPDKESIPKNMLPGLEFYNGVMMAIDSLASEGTKMEVNIYDTRQPENYLNSMLNGPELNNVSLMIGSFTSSEEVKRFGDQALKRNIPLISATYPNVGGINANPFFVLLNSSFQTHLLGIYKYLNTNYAGTNIIAFRKSGSTGDYIKNTFNDLNKNAKTAPVKIKWVELTENFAPKDVMNHLDSNASYNVVLVASPIESFGLKIVKTISSFEQYRATAVGMPTWDGIRELNSKSCRNVDIVYSTPFYYMRSDDTESSFAKRYKTKFYSRPSDMVFRGYETTFHFGKLLAKYRNNFINNLSSNQYKIFNDFDIKSVKLRESNTLPDYLENKKLYFIRKQEGNIKAIL
ncbi:MAG: hypothetical protein LH478_09390 [Chitinophagaceae bacterium]|nr:hypothetical protein [Chitinophagaceae bacterium]